MHQHSRTPHCSPCSPQPRQCPGEPVLLPPHSGSSPSTTLSPPLLLTSPRAPPAAPPAQEHPTPGPLLADTHMAEAWSGQGNLLEGGQRAAYPHWSPVPLYQDWTLLVRPRCDPQLPAPTAQWSSLAAHTGVPFRLHCGFSAQCAFLEVQACL